MRFRLTQVKITTFKKERSALKRLFDWMVERGVLAEEPKLPRIPRRALGTPHPQGKRQVVMLSPEEMDAIVARLPERSRRGYPLRAYFEFMRETGLRPSTLRRLQAPEDYQPGCEYVRIRDEIDKGGYGRELPLSSRARAAIDSLFPATGHIFPEFDARHSLRKAARAAGLDEERVGRLSPYDFRHGRGTEWAEETGNLMGIGYLMGHKHATTTNQYLNQSRRAAEAVLAGPIGTNTGRRSPNVISGSRGREAQLPEITRCGREDSNLHEFYLTRSLV